MAYLHSQIQIPIQIPILTSFLHSTVRIGTWMQLYAVWRVLHITMLPFGGSQSESELESESGSSNVNKPLLLLPKSD